MWLFLSASYRLLMSVLPALLAPHTELTLFWLALYFLISLSVLKPAGSLYGNSQLGPFQQMSTWLQQLFSSALLWLY